MSIHEVNTAAVVRSLRGSESGSLLLPLKVRLRLGCSLSIAIGFSVQRRERAGAVNDVVQSVIMAVGKPAGRVRGLTLVLSHIYTPRNPLVGKSKPFAGWWQRVIATTT